MKTYEYVPLPGNSLVRHGGMASSRSIIVALGPMRSAAAATINRHCLTATASAANNVALALKALGELDGASDAAHRAVHIYEAAYGLEHPSTARALHNVGIGHRERAAGASGTERLALLEAARAALEQAIASRRAALARAGGGDGSSAHAAAAAAVAADACLSESALGAVECELGEGAEGLRRMRGALEELRASPQGRTARATAANNLALWLHRAGGHAAEAEALYREALEVRGGDADHEGLKIMHNLAELLLEAGRHDESEAMRRAILAAAE